MSENIIFDYVLEESVCMHEERIIEKGGKIFKITSRSENVRKHIADIVKLYKTNRDRYSVIYYNLSSASWILPELIAKHMGYRVVVHSHNAMLIDANSGLIYRIMNCINRFILGHIRIDRLACSDIAAKFMFGNADFIMIYNGIDVKKYKFSEEKRKSIRKKYGISDEQFVVGVVGRLAYQKNPLFSLDIFKEIEKKKSQAVLMMLGEGDKRQELEEKIEELELDNKVILTGNVLNVNEYLNAFDVFLLPSRHEGLGIALIEAQANGLPCFTSMDVVPIEAKITELLEYIPLSDNSTIWAEKIMTKPMIYDNREEANAIASDSVYCVDSCAAKLEDVLNEKVG